MSSSIGPQPTPRRPSRWKKAFRKMYALISPKPRKEIRVTETSSPLAYGYGDLPSLSTPSFVVRPDSGKDIFKKPPPTTVSSPDAARPPPLPSPTLMVVNADDPARESSGTSQSSLASQVLPTSVDSQGLVLQIGLGQSCYTSPLLPTSPSLEQIVRQTPAVGTAATTRSRVGSGLIYYTPANPSPLSKQFKREPSLHGRSPQYLQLPSVDSDPTPFTEHVLRGSRSLPDNTLRSESGFLASPKGVKRQTSSILTRSPPLSGTSKHSSHSSLHTRASHGLVPYRVRSSPALGNDQFGADADRKPTAGHMIRRKPVPSLELNSSMPSVLTSHDGKPAYLSIAARREGREGRGRMALKPLILARSNHQRADLALSTPQTLGRPTSIAVVTPVSMLSASESPSPRTPSADPLLSEDERRAIEIVRELYGDAERREKLQAHYAAQQQRSSEFDKLSEWLGVRSADASPPVVQPARTMLGLYDLESPNEPLRSRWSSTSASLYGETASPSTETTVLPHSDNSSLDIATAEDSDHEGSLDAHIKDAISELNRPARQREATVTQQDLCGSVDRLSSSSSDQSLMTTTLLLDSAIPRELGDNGSLGLGLPVLVTASRPVPETGDLFERASLGHESIQKYVSAIATN